VYIFTGQVDKALYSIYSVIGTTQTIFVFGLASLFSQIQIDYLAQCLAPKRISSEYSEQP